MAYCVLADVEGLMGTTFSVSGRPSITDVEDFIENVAAEIDGVIQAAGYVAPATAAQAIALLKHYNILGAAVAAWHAGFVSDAAPARVEYWEQTYNAFLARLRRGEQQLPGVEPLSDLDAAFEIVPATRRDPYWTTGQEL